MGSLWEPYGKGVPFLGAPGNSLEVGCDIGGAIRVARGDLFPY